MRRTVYAIHEFCKLKTSREINRAPFVLSLARGPSLRESVQFGVAAGVAAVMTRGAELCRREEAERLYEQMNAK